MGISGHMLATELGRNLFFYNINQFSPIALVFAISSQVFLFSHLLINNNKKTI